MEGAELAAVSITAVAKFPFLHLDDKAVEFESVPVGKAVERVTRLVNPSAVPAAFTVLRAADDHDGVLSLRPLQGVLLPGEATDVLVSYTPLTPGVSTCETFKVCVIRGFRDPLYHSTNPCHKPIKGVYGLYGRFDKGRLKSTPDWYTEKSSW